jgi:UDP-2,3-diacylglucosamine hydrolase
MPWEENKKIYCLSDFHLGAPNMAASRLRENRIVEFLTSIQSTAAAVYIMGDLFDFWFEYKQVVPKGYIRLLGKLAALRDAGIPVYVFSGNHDMWMKDYFQQELDIPVYHDPQLLEWNGKKIFMGHGDGLGPGDQGYKMLKKVFRNPFCRWLFGWLHPDWGIGLANYFSRKSREKTGGAEEEFKGEDNEWLLVFAREQQQKTPVDFFVFGHRHLPLDLEVVPGCRYLNTGDWITHFTYLAFDGKDFSLQKMKS